MTVTLTGRLTCGDDDDARIVAAALPEHVRLSRDEPGCLSFEVTQDARDPLIWHVAESFVDRAAFDAHQTRTRASAWFDRTSHIARSYEIVG